MRASRPAAAGTDPGRERENNEDRILCDPERGIYAVIDGVGGESGGEVAAQTAHDILRARLSRRTTDLDRLMREAIALANRQIYERSQADPRLAGMSCVLTVALLDGDKATIGHVGDSRLYLLKPGEIRKVTRDHSPVGTREDAGELSESEAMSHPRRNEIFRDVGSAPHEPDDPGFVEIHQIPFTPDSALLLCSDGLSDLVTSARIREAVEAHAGDPKAAVDRLIAEANEAGGKDNISVVLVEGERYADGFRKAGAQAAGPTGRPAPRQYGAAHARESGMRRVLRALSWLLLLAVLAGAAYAVYDPRIRETLLALLPIGGAGTPEPVPAAVLRVGPSEADFATISEALAEARPGQTVEVAPGEYREAVTLREGVALVSATPRGAVILPPVVPDPGTDAPAAPAAPAAITARGVRARISGFRISGSPVGLRLEDSHIEATELEILGAAEAGIEIAGADRSAITTCYVHDNPGAGIVVSGGAAPQIRQNLITANGTPKDRGTPRRPGVEVRGDARPLLVDNRIEGNAAAGVWLPSLERRDEIFQWNRFGNSTRAQAVQAAPQSGNSAAPATPGRRR